MINVLIADDHFVVRSGLCALLDSEGDIRVVAEAKDGLEAIEAYRKVRPDVVLLDLRMPNHGGEYSVEVIKREFPEARILIFSAFSGDEEIHRALKLGALGYVFKSTAGEHLIPAVRAVATGKAWIPKDVSSQLAHRKIFEDLTARELEVLKKIAKGLSNKEIADKLGISDYTIKDHVKNIMSKLHVSARTEAVTIAIKRGIIEV